MIHNLKKYFNIINCFFFFLIILLLIAEYFFKLSIFNKYLICFLLITTIGVSHGALDNLKGQNLLSNKYKFWKPIFYFTYITLILIVICSWYLSPTISLIVFLIISSFHFGKEDLEIYISKKHRYYLLIYFLKGSLIILLPLFFNFNETNLIFNKILFLNNFTLISYSFVKYFLLLNLSVQFLIYSYLFLKKSIKKSDLISIIFEIFLITFVFYFFNIIVAFTLYFCFMHSLKNIIMLSSELDANILKGINNFIKKALTLTIITFLASFACLLVLSNIEIIENSVQKIIFIGLASLTLPHIILHYFFENYLNTKNKI